MPNEQQTLPPLSHSAAESGTDLELAEAMRQTFEEIGSSNSRIVESLDRLNKLALEIYGELDATTKALSLHR